MRVISISKDSGTKERKKEVTGLVKADKLDKEKFLNEVLKLQSDLLQITDYKSLLTQIEGLLQSSPLFDKVEVISSDIGKEKPIPLRANDHVFSVENENVVSKFKVRAINLTQFQEYLPYFDNLFQFVRKLIDQRQNIIFKYMPNSFINIFKGSDLPIIIFNMETYQINDANEQACKLYGFTLKELKAKLICDLFTLSPKDPKKKKPTLKPPANGITQSVRADGAIMDVLVRINDFVADDNNYGFMIVEDITQYLKLQKEQQRIYNYIDRTKRFESLRFLLRGAAHDFNNYLSAIIGFTELSILELGGDFPEITANLTEIEKASHNCKELVKSILRFGKHDEEMKGMFNLIDLIKDVVVMIKSGIRKTINLEFIYDNIDDAVYFDPLAIQEVVVNIVMNAVQALPDGKGDIQVKLSLLDNLSKTFYKQHPNLKNDKYFLLTVEDNGIGIPDNELGKVFEPFFTTKENQLGLGLTTANNILKEENGDIEIMKGDGDKGTKVLMYIPVIVTHIEEEEQDAHVSFDSHVSASILILDDESQITVYMKKILEGKGFLVHTENNPNAALTLFHKHINFFDLVICNLNMPDMSGVEFITKVRDMQKDVPIIMVSGDQPEKEITENEKLNISAYLTKPVTMATLETTINQVLSQK